MFSKINLLALVLASSTTVLFGCGQDCTQDHEHTQPTEQKAVPAENQNNAKPE